nr:MAG TPA: hypothetical protein [Bacteriophage sp.]
MSLRESQSGKETNRLFSTLASSTAIIVSRRTLFPFRFQRVIILCAAQLRTIPAFLSPKLTVMVRMGIRMQDMAAVMCIKYVCRKRCIGFVRGIRYLWHGYRMKRVLSTSCIVVIL